MGDGSAIGGWILAAAVITVLAGGANAVNSGSDSSSSGSTGNTGSTSAAASRSATSASRSFVPCTRATRGVSTDGTHYKIMPASESGSLNCRLQLGDSGRAVTVLQQALLMCSNRAVTVDGTFSEDTRGALLRDQARQLNLTPTGVYDPTTARSVRWPWYPKGTSTFTGHCGQALDREVM